MRRLFTQSIFLLILCFIFFTACKKEVFTNDSNAMITKSTDSVKFDTVFTSVGSVTQYFKIRNNNNLAIRISSIKLMGGATSAFKLNIDGVSNSEVRDLELPANDSIYVFVSLTINPNSNSLPFIVSDSILISWNGNNQFVQLEGYGQNAHFMNNQTIHNDTAWNNDLPYVIVGQLKIDSASTLSLLPGCKIFAHANSKILVNGTLLVNGEKNKEVVFTGDRLDEYYKDIPGSWPGLYFNTSSKKNILKYAIIKNAIRGIEVNNPSETADPKLTIHQTTIDNAFEYGIFAHNSSIDIDNSIISNCENNIQIEFGGVYNFTNCTAVGYSTKFISHDKPVLQTNNFYDESGTIFKNDLTATFKNCIFWGSGGLNENEILFQKEEGTVYQVTLENCLYKINQEPSFINFLSCINNQMPAFDSVDVYNNYFDFRTTKDDTSPNINTGTITNFSKDLDDKIRMIGITDIGCYEKQ